MYKSQHTHHTHPHTHTHTTTTHTHPSDMPTEQPCQPCTPTIEQGSLSLYVWSSYIEYSFECTSQFLIEHDHVSTHTSLHLHTHVSTHTSPHTHLHTLISTSPHIHLHTHVSTHTSPHTLTSPLHTPSHLHSHVPHSRGGGASVAKTLDLLKAVLQSSFNMEVKRLCDDYLHIFSLAASNIRENTGDSVPEATLKLLVCKMMEEVEQEVSLRTVYVWGGNLIPPLISLSNLPLDS